MKSFTGKEGLLLIPRFAWVGFFNMEVQFWLNLQSHYDLEIEKDSIGKEIQAIKPWRKVA